MPNFEENDMTKITHNTWGPAKQSVSALSLGSWHTWDRAVFEETTQMLREALDAGMNMFDVGVYRSKGLNSIDPYDHPTDLIFAHAMQKIGAIAGKHYDLAIKAWIKPGATVTEQVDNLLWRQDVEHAKYVVLGDLVSEMADYGPLVAELGALIKAGKVDYWAVNNWSTKEIADITAKAVAMGVPVPQFAQLKYSVFRRTIAEGAPFKALIDKTGIAIQASDVMEGGLAFDNGTSRIIALDVGSIQAKIRASREAFAKAAASLGATPAQVAVAFPLTHPDCANVLIGTRTLAQFRDNLGAFDLLNRVSAADIRAAVKDLWLDQEVDAEASWSGQKGDKPENYMVVRR